MSTVRRFRFSSGLLLAALLSVGVASVAGAEEGRIPQLDPCNQPVVASWTAGADQYTDYYSRMLAFAASIPAPTARAAARPERLGSGAQAQTQYKRDLAVWRAAVAADQAAATRAATRLKEDVDTAYARAKEDAQLNASNRGVFIDQNYSAERSAIQACEQILEAQASADYATQAENLSYGLQVDSDNAQATYQSTIKSNQDIIDAQTKQVTQNTKDAMAACKVLAGQLISLKGLKGKKLTAAKKHNQQVTETLKACQDKVRRGEALRLPSKPKQRRVTQRVNNEVTAVQNSKTSITAAQTAIDGADGVLATTIRDRQHKFSLDQISLQNTFTTNGIRSTFSYERALTELDKKQGLCASRSDRQLTDELRALDDAYTLSLRTLQDLYGVDTSSL